MKLTEQKLRQIIRKTIQEAGAMGGLEDYTDMEGHHNYNKKGHNKIQTSTPGFASKESKAVVETQLKQHSVMLKKVKYNLIKDWLEIAKAGKADWFDIRRVLVTGDVKRASLDELNFMRDVIESKKVQNAFKRYFKGKRGMSTRKWK